MHLLATDGLTCPRCGPEFPLILLADDVQDRQVLKGSLGCPNCRDRYPIEDGFADLRPEPRTEDGPHEPMETIDPDGIERVGALLGVSGESSALLLGTASRWAPGLSRLLPDARIYAASPETASWPESPGVERLRVASRIPFRDWTLRGVVLEGAAAENSLTEAIRVLAPGHRVVVLDGGSEVRDAMLARGLKVSTPADGVVLGARGGP